MAQDGEGMTQTMSEAMVRAYEAPPTVVAAVRPTKLSRALCGTCLTHQLTRNGLLRPHLRTVNGRRGPCDG